MKNLLYITILLISLYSCKGEDDLGNTMKMENEYAITDDINDPVQHERFLIYEEFGVPVYFNDTIKKVQTGTDWYGNPIYKTETVDLNWSFESYDSSTKYSYDYLQDEEDKMNALTFARSFLSKASRPMRPFSILLVNNLFIETDKIETPQYFNGLRTLVFSEVSDMEDETEIDELSTKVLNDMVLSRVNNNQELCDKFKEISSKNGWYGKSWESLNCTNEILTGDSEIYGDPSYMYSEYPYSSYDDIGFPEFNDIIDDIVDDLTYYDDELSIEDATSQAIALRDEMATEMGNLGFITCSKNVGIMTPDDADDDRKFFVELMLNIGDSTFRERFGKSALVMEKYEILYDYIKNELKIQL